MKRKYSAPAIILSLLLVLSVSLSFIFLIRESDHECSEEHCHICAMMQSASCNIHSLSLLVHINVLAFITVPATIGITDFIAGYCFDNTLVGQKIRLND